MRNFLLALCMVAAFPAQAKVYVQELVRTGSIDQNGAIGDVWSVGENQAGGEVRAFFMVNVSGFKGNTKLKQANIRLYVPRAGDGLGFGLNISDGFSGGDSSERLTVYRFDGDVARLALDKIDGDTFDDLGNGQVYGVANVTVENNGNYLIIELNEAGIEALNRRMIQPDNSEYGWSFVIGAAMTTLNNPAIIENVSGTNSVRLPASEIVLEVDELTERELAELKKPGKLEHDLTRVRLNGMKDSAECPGISELQCFDSVMEELFPSFVFNFWPSDLQDGELYDLYWDQIDQAIYSNNDWLESALEDPLDHEESLPRVPLPPSILLFFSALGLTALRSLRCG